VPPIKASGLHLLGLIDKSGNNSIEPEELMEFVDGIIKTTSPDGNLDELENAAFLGITESSFTSTDGAKEILLMLDEITAETRKQDIQAVDFSNSIPVYFRNLNTPQILPEFIDTNSLKFIKADLANCKPNCKAFEIFLNDEKGNHVVFTSKIKNTTLDPLFFMGDILLTVMDYKGYYHVEDYVILKSEEAFYFGELLTKIAHVKGEFRPVHYKHYKQFNNLFSMVSKFTTNLNGKPSVDNPCLEKMIAYAGGVTAPKDPDSKVSLQIYYKPSRFHVNTCRSGMALYLHLKLSTSELTGDFRMSDIGGISAADIMPKQANDYSDSLQIIHQRKINKSGKENIVKALPQIYQHMLALNNRDDLILSFFVRPLSAVSTGIHHSITPKKP